jgi:hypothetical protein
MLGLAGRYSYGNPIHRRGFVVEVGYDDRPRQAGNNNERHSVPSGTNEYTPRRPRFIRDSSSRYHRIPMHRNQPNSTQAPRKQVDQLKRQYEYTSLAPRLRARLPFAFRYPTSEYVLENNLSGDNSPWQEDELEDIQQLGDSADLFHDESCSDLCADHPHESDSLVSNVAYDELDAPGEGDGLFPFNQQRSLVRSPGIADNAAFEISHSAGVILTLGTLQPQGRGIFPVNRLPCSLTTSGIAVDAGFAVLPLPESYHPEGGRGGIWSCTNKRQPPGAGIFRPKKRQLGDSPGACENLDVEYSHSENWCHQGIAVDADRFDVPESYHPEGGRGGVVTRTTNKAQSQGAGIFRPKKRQPGDSPGACENLDVDYSHSEKCSHQSGGGIFPCNKRIAQGGGIWFNKRPLGQSRALEAQYGTDSLGLGPPTFLDVPSGQHLQTTSDLTDGCSLPSFENAWDVDDIELHSCAVDIANINQCGYPVEVARRDDVPPTGILCIDNGVEVDLYGVPLSSRAQIACTFGFGQRVDQCLNPGEVARRDDSPAESIRCIDNGVEVDVYGVPISNRPKTNRASCSGQRRVWLYNDLEDTIKTQIDFPERADEENDFENFLMDMQNQNDPGGYTGIWDHFKPTAATR